MSVQQPRDSRTGVQTAVESLACKKACNALLNTLPDMVFRLSAKGVLLEYSGGGNNRLVVLPPGSVGKHVDDLFPPEIVKSWMDGIRAVTISGGPYVTECEYQVSGNLRRFEARLVRWGDDEVLAIVGGVRGVDDRRRDERQHRFIRRVARPLADATSLPKALRACLGTIPPTVRRVLQSIAAQIGSTRARLRVQERLRRNRQDDERAKVRTAQPAATSAALQRQVLDLDRISTRLSHRMELEELVTSTCSRVAQLTPEALDQGLHAALAALGTVGGVDRTSIFQFNGDRTALDRTHEWCSEGVEPQRAHEPGVSAIACPWWMDQMERGQTIHWPRVSALPADASTGRMPLNLQGVQSLVVIPLMASGILVGCLTLEAVWSEMAWPAEDIRLLTLVAQCMANTLLRTAAQLELEAERGRLAERVRSGPEGVLQTDADRASTQKAAAASSTQKAAAASEAMSIFVAAMSHEVRTPINGIVGLTELLLRDHPAPRQIDRLLLLRRSAGLLTQLLGNVVELVRMESGNLTLLRQPFELREVVEQLIHCWHDTAIEKGLALIQEVDARVPDRLQGDALRLQLVLGNLVHDAIQDAESGKVELSVRSVRCTSRTATVVFRVSGTGSGISTDRQEAFSQARPPLDGSPVRQRNGSELGMRVSTRLVHHMGGTIQTERAANQGSSTAFELTFTVAVPPVEAVVRPESTVPVPALRVLLAEDNAINQLVAQELLESGGHTVHAVANGREAVEALREDEFDIVLMDVQMPIMDGLEATREIRRLEGERGGRIPIIALTANAMAGSSELFMAAGMDAHLVKPLQMRPLEETMARTLGRQQPDTQA